MLSLSKKNILFILFVLTAYLSSSCEKDQIAPANQEVAFVKYYGHVGAQTASDVIQTSDGGYILLGSTNSYSTRQEMDILVVKTDSLGNELWSSAFGRANVDRVTTNADYLRFSEEGIRIIELPDESAYVVAANRTYFKYSNSSSPAGSGVKGETKIVLYQLDPATGAPSTNDGVELEESTGELYTEEVSDMKIDTSGGAYSYILTGYTTDIQPNKPNDNDNGALDKTDIFTALLDASFTIQWTTSSLAYGFPRADYGSSVQILDGGYLICGTSEEKTTVNNQSVLLPRIITVIMEKSGGTPLNVNYFTADDYYFEGGNSVYDADNHVITIASHVTREGASGEEGKVALLQVSEDLVAVTPNAAAPTYCKYYDLQDRNGISGKQHSAAAIALIPGNNGFVLTSTQKISEFESDLCVTKFDKDLNIEDGWPYYFGYADGNSLVLTQDEAGSVLPIMSGTTVAGYVFTGKFGLGTNEMMGLVRLNSNGTLVP
jgi:hypothetical protein